MTHDEALGRYVRAQDAAQKFAKLRRDALAEIGRRARRVIDDEMSSSDQVIAEFDLDRVRALLAEAEAAQKAMAEAMARANEVAADAERPIMRLKPARW